MQPLPSPSATFQPLPPRLAARGLRWRLAEAAEGADCADCADRAFLQQLFASTRARELEALGPDSPLAMRFMAMQFAAREQAYRAAHPGAQQRIIERVFGADSSPAIGLLWVDVTASQIDLLDISLLPDWRGRGVGRSLLGALLDEAQVLRKPVLLQVQVDNPARRLYARLGFSEVARTDLHLAMCWTPASPPHIDPAAETVHEQA